MVNAGIKGSPDGLNWQSLEQRAEKIKALSADNNIYSGALLFLMYICIMKLLKLFPRKGKLVFLFLLCSMLQLSTTVSGRKNIYFWFSLLLLCYLALVMSLRMLNQYRHHGLCASSCLYRF